MKIAVLGAGVSGLSAARLLKDKGHDVTVYEKESTVGGLARSRYVDGILYDPHGGHILNSKKPEVMDWAFSVLPKEKWQYTARNAKIYFNGKYVSYPFELSLCELDIDDAVNCVHDFILAQNGPEPDNFRDWLVWNFGQSIADYYMLPYNEKIWAYPLEQMETKWMQGKMPLPSKKEMIHSMLLKDPTERKMPHSTFYYPIDGGIQSFMNAIAQGLNIRCNAEIKTISKTEKGWTVNQSETYDHVISTIPLPVLGKVMTEIPDVVKDCIADLKYNSLTTVLFECPETDITWLYIPSKEYRSHRVGYQSALTPHANPKPGMGAGALEIIGNRFDVSELDKKEGILPAELQYRQTLDSEFTEYAYVIHDLHYRENIETVKGYFNTVEGFDLLGRWGAWNYKNMDLCISDAMEIAKKL
ncbi:MAG: FAD-dependent oxidoreductase [Alphaproteobacteria bacterium]|nr:FAD-dependent oxidoreductase [Alphaproteobacteria bacterium]